MRRSGVQWLLAGLVTAVLVVLAWEHRWMSDDGFIHLRVVEQLRGGNGPVFNVGERVEASTSPLWVLLLALADPVTGLALPWKAVLLGIAMTAVGLVAAQAAGWTLARARASGDDRGVLVLPVGALVVALLPPFWDFASSGLESGLVFAWIGGSSWWCAHRATARPEPSPRAELAGAALVGLGWLIRPDLLVFSLAFGAVVVAATWGSTRRRRVGVVVAMLAVPTAHQVFRMGYYAMLVPNTALAKEAGRAQWAQGWRYLSNLMGPHRLWLPVGLVVLVLVVQTGADVRAGDRLRAAARLAPAAAALVHGAYTLRVGGDFMHGRLLLPALFGLIAPVGVALPLAAPGTWWRWEDSWGRAAMAGGAVVVAWAGATVLLFDPGPVAGPKIEDERLLVRFAFVEDHPIRLDLGARSSPVIDEMFLPPEEGQVGVLALGDPNGADSARVGLRTELPVSAAAVPPGLGAGSYGLPLDVYSVDPGSLANPVGSHLDLWLPTRPGHQKTMPVVWQVAGLGEMVAVRTDDGRVLASRRDHAAAHRAVSCGRMAEYLDDIRAPLTPGRFLGNLVDSFGNTLFRIPPDPQEAESDLCG